MALWQEVFEAEEKPPLNIWVPTIDSTGNYRICRWTGLLWQSRDINSTESPEYKPVWIWLSKIEYKSNKLK